MSNIPLWATATAAEAERTDIVEIWCLDLADAAWDRRSSPGVLGPTAASRRAWQGVRHLLGRRLGVRGDQLRFEQDAYGKPRLVGDAMAFNIAHSGETALIALSAAPVGIDLEQTLPIDAELEDLAQEVLHASERAAWLALRPASRLTAFYRTWVRKEAHLKLSGIGLRQSMTDLAINGASAEDMTIRDTTGGERCPYSHVRDLELGTGFAAAVCSLSPLTKISVQALAARLLTDDVAHV